MLQTISGRHHQRLEVAAGEARLEYLDWKTLHLACCFYLTGVIWVIQLTHYPAFSVISESDFVRFHARHTAVMGGIVGPAMILELLSALVLARQLHMGWLLNLSAVAVIWIVTFALSVPSHSKLSRGRDLDEIDKLVRDNWTRTILWTVRAAVLLGTL